MRIEKLQESVVKLLSDSGNPNTFSLLIVFSLFLIFCSVLVNKHSQGELVLSWQRKPIGGITKEIGFAYQSPLGRVWMSSHNKYSPAELYENGRPLGPGNSLHDDIRNKGNGRFSFWHDYLYFSSSDNTDPIKNNRSYEIRWPTPISGAISIPLSSIAFLLCTYTLCILLYNVKRRILDAELEVNFRNVVKQLPWSREGRGRVLNSTAVWSTVVIVSAVIYYGLYEPIGVIDEIIRLTLYSAVLSICGMLGFLCGLGLNEYRKFSIKVIVQLVGVLLILCFLLLSPYSKNTSIQDLMADIPLLLLAGLCGVLVYLLFGRRELLQNPITANAEFADRKTLYLVILFCVLIAAPILLKQVIKFWDISGWMDSHMYDMNAHQIATREVLHGSSFVMPLYQYGMAAIYFIFGHFFYIQQTVNVIFAVIGSILLCLTAWNIFRNVWAVLLTGVLYAFTGQFHRYLNITQIENWYIPLIILTLYFWSCYWRRSNLFHLLLLGISIGLAFNTRLQGIFYFSFLCLTPFFVLNIDFKNRVLHFLFIFIVVAICMVPWSVRNYLVENRLGFSTGQSKIALMLNDHRLAFYGIRYLLNWDEVQLDYIKKYPDEQERSRAVRRDFFRNTFGDPKWLGRAVFWRSASLYGLLPPGVWNKDGPEPTDWRSQWQSYLYLGFPSIFYIVFSLMGFLKRPNRMSFFLLLAILSLVAITVTAPTREPRYSYPIIPLHLLLGMFLFFEAKVLAEDDTFSLGRYLSPRRKKSALIICTLCVLMLIAFFYISVGRDNLFRRLIEPAIVIDKSVSVDPNLPSLNEYYRWSVNKSDPRPEFKTGEKVRLKCKVTNYMLPPKTGSVIPYLPEFASDPQRETYYYGYPGEDSGGVMGISFFGARADSVIRENDIVEVEGEIIFIDRENTILPAWFWVKVEKMHKVST